MNIHDSTQSTPARMLTDHEIDALLREVARLQSLFPNVTFKSDTLPSVRMSTLVDMVQASQRRVVPAGIDLPSPRQISFGMTNGKPFWIRGWFEADLEHLWSAK